MKRRLRYVGSVFCLMSLFTTAGQAETLADALTAAYENNPKLMAARATLRARDEDVAQAAAVWRPRINAKAGYQRQYLGIPGFRETGRSTTAGVSVQMPLVPLRSNVSAAEAGVEAVRADLLKTENEVMLAVVTAYMNVLRDRAVRDLKVKQVEVLRENLRSATDRFKIGQLTRTDVAQSAARLASAQADLASAELDLNKSAQDYFQQVGHAPDILSPPPPTPEIPESADVVEDTALKESPAVLEAYFAEKAAEHAISVARSHRMPSLSAEAGLNWARQEAPNGQLVAPAVTAQSIGVALTIPLWQGGESGSRIRQAKEQRSVRIANIAATHRQVRAAARQAYEGLRAARAGVEANQEAFRANRLALEGTRKENQVGARTILDVLNAEQELLNARVSLIRSQNAVYISTYQILAVMGRARTDIIGLGVQRFDPQEYYDRVRNSRADWGIK